MKKDSNINILIAIGIIVVAIISRFIPHQPNFTAVGAIGLFGAAHFNKRWMAFVIPFIALWLSDLVLNNVVYSEYYHGFQLFGDPFVYGAFIAVIGIGAFLLKKVNFKNILVASTIISVVFYLVTNFGVWLLGPLYPKSPEGLLACYIAALPFFWNTLAGNVFYSIVLFKVYDWIKVDRPVVTA